MRDDLRAMCATYNKAVIEYPTLPTWDALSTEMRETFIQMFYAGRRFEAEYQDAQRKRIEGEVP